MHYTDFLFGILIVTMLALVGISELFKRSETLTVAFMKISIGPIGLLFFIFGCYVTKSVWAGGIFAIVFLVTLIGSREGIVHYYLVKKGYPLQRNINWWYLSIKEAKCLPEIEQRTRGYSILKAMLHNKAKA